MCPARELSARPLRADAERNRRRILSAAAEVFARRGLDAGLDEIARHAGVGTGTVYRRFPEKSLLVDALFESRFEALYDLAEQCAGAEDPWQGLVRFCEEMVAMQIADRGLREALFDDTHLNERLAAARDRLRPVLATIVRRAQETGDLRPDVTVTDLAMLQLMVDSAGSFCHAVRPELWRRQLGILLDGFRTRRDGPAPLPVPPLSEEQLAAAAACGPGKRRS